jgi:aldose 1-epimerase
VGSRPPRVRCGDAHARHPVVAVRQSDLIASVTKAPFGRLPDGAPVECFTLVNAHSLELRALTYGGIITSLSVPDRHGHLGDIVLGHDSLDDYRNDSNYFGAIIGRSANRIAGARFILDGKTYRLTANDGVNHLHGGHRGFDRVVWQGDPFTTEDSAGVALTYLSPDGEEGYPGNVNVRVSYALTDHNELVVDMLATTDRPTPVNLTQHSSFDLSGGTGDDILGHLLWINAELMTPVGKNLIPTGDLVSVGGGPFDFRTLTPIGERIDEKDEQLRYGRGYDHNFVLIRTGPGLSYAARLMEPDSGRTLDLYTTESGLQLYPGNHIGEQVVGKGGRRYGPRAGLCLETQHFPDAPNQPGFPSTVLRPGEEYRSRTVFAFGVSG